VGGPAGRDAVPFGDHVVDAGAEVGKGTPVQRDELPDILGVMWLCRHTGRVGDGAGSVRLVHDGQIPRVERLVDETPDERLVLFGGHSRASFVCRLRR
jgi:hypothetical protein